MLEAAEQAARAGDLESADALLRDALRLQEATLGALHPELANTLNNLAIVAEKTGRLDEAETFYRRAVAIATESLPAGDPMIAASRENLEAFCRAHGLPLDVPALVASPAPERSDGAAASRRAAGGSRSGRGSCPGRGSDNRAALSGVTEKPDVRCIDHRRGRRPRRGAARVAPVVQRATGARSAIAASGEDIAPCRDAAAGCAASCCRASAAACHPVTAGRSGSNGATPTSRRAAQ